MEEKTRILAQFFLDNHSLAHTHDTADSDSVRKLMSQCHDLETLMFMEEHLFQCVDPEIDKDFQARLLRVAQETHEKTPLSYFTLVRLYNCGHIDNEVQVWAEQTILALLDSVGNACSKTCPQWLEVAIPSVIWNSDKHSASVRSKLKDLAKNIIASE